MSLKLLVGLGNPGPEYEVTRHNAGFMLLDRLAIGSGAKFKLESRMHSQLVRLKESDLKGGPFKLLAKAQFELLLAKPMTYMNLSGTAVAQIVRFFKINKNDIIVAHDEVALPAGQIRLKRGGGSAGHHGIESLIESLAFNDFQRVRIGVGPDPGGAVRAHYLTSRIQDKDLELIDKTVELALAATECCLVKGMQEAMNQFNGIDLCRSKEQVLATEQKQVKQKELMSDNQSQLGEY